MSKLICPHCGAFTAFSPARVRGKGILVDRSDETTTTYGEVEISAMVPYVYSYGNEAYAILVCRACDEFFVARRDEYSQDSVDSYSAVYPIQHKPAAQEIPEPIKQQFEEAQLCFAVGAYVGCLLVCRTALIALQREQNISNLNDLKEKGVISRHLYEQSNEIRLWANMIGHEDIRKGISKEDAEQLLIYLETILNAVYVEPKRLAKLTQKRDELKGKA